MSMTSEKVNIPVEKLKWMYETMVKSRYYEDTMVEAYNEGKKPVFNIGAGPVPGEMHLSTGQEPAAVGICAHLKKEDTVSSPHRPHHHAIAKGVDLKRMTAEMYGKVTGLGKGKGGHMHLFDPEVKFSCGGIIAAGIPQAVGAAIPVKVYDQLVQSVNKGLPLMHRYMDLKKKMLGVDELHMYDIYTPIVEADRTYVPYEDAKKKVLDGLEPMGRDYVGLMKKAFNGGWIDVYSTEDKRTGAYQSGAYDTHPYVLLNYQGTKNDVYTIAHELGHAAHSNYSKKNQPYLTSDFATFTAEVASTLNESILWDNEYKKAKSKAEKMYLLNLRLENFRTTLFRQTQFAEFEKTIHELDQKGESLNAEAIKKVYGDINKKYYGPSMAADQEIPMEWARIPHFYNYNFYVYQYATSFAASAALSKQVLEQGSPAVKRIKAHLLDAGGSTDPISILKGAGVDMSTSKPIDQAMEVFEDTLDELEKLINEK